MYWGLGYDRIVDGQWQEVDEERVSRIMDRFARDDGMLAQGNGFVRQ